MCHQGSRVFEPGPCGLLFGFARDRLCNSPEMAARPGHEGRDQAASLCKVTDL